MSKTAASAAISTQYGFTNGANWTVTLIFLQEDTTMTEKNDTKQLIDRLEATRNLSRDEWIRLIQNRTADDADYLFDRAPAVRTRH